MCSHREEAYADIPLRHRLTNSEQAQDRCILLPLYPQMTPKDQQRVAAAFTSCRNCRPHANGRATFACGTTGATDVGI
jgi:dTDP-4-amino-4,6-dideoxygalactose transaminase